MRRLLYFITLTLCAAMATSLTSVQAQDIIGLGGTITAEFTGNGSAEAVDKLIDKNIGTKYLTFNGAPLFIKWQCNAPQVAAQYALTSGNDSAERDPFDWTFEGSNNDTDWTILDTRTGETFADYGTTNTYNFTNTTAYTYYRLNITALAGAATIFQLAEWGIAGSNPPDAPSLLVAVATSGQEVVLTWKDNATSESSFVVERSENGTDFTPIATVGANVTTYTDRGVAMGTIFYYRLKAVNYFGASAYIGADVTTLNWSATPVDLTNDGGILTVLHENPDAAENGLKLIDNSIDTKYLIPSSKTLPYWFRYESTTGADRWLTKYTITSGGDAATRDPKDWVLEGSNDGAIWTIADTRTGFLFASRKQTATFALTAPVKYKYYQIRVTANNGSTGIPGQITEWELWGIDPTAPAVPQNVTATALSKKIAEITWEDATTEETGYELFRSEDGINFVLIKTTGVDETSYTDIDRKGGLTYYYRLRTLYGGGKATIFSRTASVIMPGQNTSPTLDALDDIITCNASADRVVALAGITPGEEIDEQTVVLSATIKAADRALFEKTPSVTEVIDGKANLSFKIDPAAKADTVFVYVTVKDDGGTGNNGIDTKEDSIQVIFEPLPVAVSLATALPLPRGTTIKLNATGAEQYAWEEGPGIIAGSSTAELTVRPTQGYSYVVNGKNAEGCERTASFFVSIDGSYSLDPANILTPDQDGKNDTWVVWNIHIFEGNRVSVYDRAGKQVFSMKDYTNDWTGTYQGSPLATGVYYYVIEPGAGIKPLKGSLTIIRYDK